VAYPAPKGVKLRPVIFSSREQLLQDFQAAIPEFKAQLAAGGEEPQVLFAAEMELTTRQLSLLGLVK
jgi:hypothetical protein